MILNILILIFLLLMAAWYAGQGLYTGLIHLLLTVFSGALALALWEPIVYGLLLGLIPEYAWGVGLLVPFAAILFGLRMLFDKLLIGNQDFHNMLSKIGGGAAGLISGVLTVGLTVIGLQMIGMNGLLGYVGWKVENGRPAKANGLWAPVDRITADFYERLGGGSLNPIGSDRGMPRVHPNLAAESSFYTQGVFGVEHTGAPSKRALLPAHVSYTEDAFYSISSVPEKLRSKLPASRGNTKVIILGTKVNLQPAEGPSPADGDAVFRVSRLQVALLCAGESGPAEVHLPVGYIQNGQFGPMTREGEFAYSNPSVPRVRHRWVFQVPADCKPSHLRMKQVRLPVPDQPISEPRRVAQLLTYTEPKTAQAEDGGDSSRRPRGSGSMGRGPRGSMGPQGSGRAPGAAGRFGPSGSSRQRSRPGRRRGGQPGTDAKMVTVSGRLPFAINKNALASENVEVVGDAIRRGRGSVQRGDRPGSNLAVDKVNSAKTARIVQVDLGTPDQAGSLLGQVMSFARRNTQAPALLNERGDPFRAIGFGIIGGNSFTFEITPNQPLRSLSRINMGNIREGERLILYYQIPQGTHLTEFQLGESKKQSLDLVVQ